MGATPSKRSSSSPQNVSFVPWFYRAPDVSFLFLEIHELRRLQDMIGMEALGGAPGGDATSLNSACNLKIVRYPWPLPASFPMRDRSIAWFCFTDS